MKRLAAIALVLIFSFILATSYASNTHEKTEFVLNTKTLEFHYPSCTNVNQINDENKGTFTGKRVEIIRQLYRPCNECDPFTNKIAKEPTDLPRKLEPENYNGPECWLLYENECEMMAANTKVYEVYAKINTSDKGWHDQVKDVIEMLAIEFEDYDEYYDTIIKITNMMPNKYNNYIALWDSYPAYIWNPSNRLPEIRWYANGSGMHAKYTLEQWEP